MTTHRMVFKPVLSQTLDRYTIYLAAERVIVIVAKLLTSFILIQILHSVGMGLPQVSKWSGKKLFKPNKVKEKSESFVSSQGKLTS